MTRPGSHLKIEAKQMLWLYKFFIIENLIKVNHLIKDDIVKESHTFYITLIKVTNTNENYGPLHLVSRLGGYVSSEYQY